jgi:2-polyprenyl-6-methoxyphenol hydroxylase-like FAD-dependent oxidoreductase
MRPGKHKTRKAIAISLLFSFPFVWWVVEPSWEGKPIPEDPKSYLIYILKDWEQPMPQFLDATNFGTRVYWWEIYNRPSLKKWTKGRIACVGDAVHPVSPCAVMAWVWRLRMVITLPNASMA